MSTQKTWIGFTFVCLMFLAVDLLGLDHRTGNLNSIGWAILGTFAAAAVWLTRYW